MKPPTSRPHSRRGSSTDTHSTAAHSSVASSSASRSEGWSAHVFGTRSEKHVDAEFQGVMAWRGSKENPFEPLPELCLTVHTPEELQTSVARKAACATL